MKNIWIILFGLFLIGMVAIGLGLQWRGRVQERKLETLEPRLTDADPARRADSARGILQIDPNRNDVRFVLARALIETGQPKAARRALNWFHDRQSASFSEAQLLRAETYLVEAELAVARSRASTINATRRDVEDRLEKVALIRGQLEIDFEYQVQIAVLEARGLECVLMLERRNLRGLTRRVAKVREQAFSMENESVDSDMAQLRKRIESIQKQLAIVCHQVIGLDPANAQVRAFLFDLFLYEGDFDQARATATELTELSRADPGVVGLVAEVLLNIELLYGKETTPADLALARRLLQHPDIAASRHIAVRVARLALRLHDGHTEQAHDEGQAILADYPGHLRAECLLAEVQIRRGEVEHAVDRLERIRFRVDSWRVVYSLGRALIAAGRLYTGQQTLKQSLDMRPGNLLALLDLVQSMADPGHIIEAEPHIQAAAELNPEHRRVLAFQTRLAVERVDRDGLVAMLHRAWNSKQAVVLPEDVLLAVAMTLDNTVEVNQACQARRQRDGGDVLMLIADAWLKTRPLNRIAIAAVIRHTIGQHLEVDPMAHRKSPPLTVVARMQPGMLGLESLDGELPVRQMLAETPFYAWPQKESLDQVHLALTVWPQHHGLHDAARRLALWLMWQVRTPDVPEWSVVRQDTPTARLIRLIQALRTEDDDLAVDRALQGLLEHHRWSQLSVLMVLADALEHKRDARIERVLELVGRLNPDLERLLAARIDVAKGRPLEGLAKLDSFQDGHAIGTQVYRMSSDLQARANLAAGRADEAIAVFETLVMSSVERRYAMQLAMVDVMIDANRADAANAALMNMLEVATVPPYWLDRVLARLEMFVQPKQLVRILDRSTRSSVRLLIELYLARTLIRQGDWTEARQVAAQLCQMRPKAPRIIALADRLTVEPVSTPGGDPERAQSAHHRESASLKIHRGSEDAIHQYRGARAEEGRIGKQGDAVK